jgi:hypothetical protein
MLDDLGNKRVNLDICNAQTVSLPIISQNKTSGVMIFLQLSTLNNANYVELIIWEKITQHAHINYIVLFDIH